MGDHQFSYYVHPHKGSLHDAQIVREAWNVNVPFQHKHLQLLGTPHETSKSYFSLKDSNNGSVILNTVKRSEVHHDCIVVRLYEANGGRSSCVLSTPLQFKAVTICNMLEEVGDDVGEVSEFIKKTVEEDQKIHKVTTKGNEIFFEMPPFKVLTLMLYF